MPLFKSLSSKSIQEYKVAVWRISEDESELRNGLSLSEQSEKRLLQMKSESQRKAFLAIRQLLEVFGHSDESLYYNDSGKPFLKEVHSISISHAQQYAALALGFNCEVGIDIERHREQIERIAHKFSGSGAVQQLHDRAQRIEKLTIIWGAKESIYKILDRRGLSFKKDIRVDDFQLASKHSSAWTDDARFHFSFDTFDHHSLVYTYKTKELS